MIGLVIAIFGIVLFRLGYTEGRIHESKKCKEMIDKMLRFEDRSN